MKTTIFLILSFLLVGNIVNSFTLYGESSNSLRNKIQTSLSATSPPTIEKTQEEWREILTPEQFYVLREEGTEAPNSSDLNLIKQDGIFCCAGCGSPLFSSKAKFDSGTGWPSFYSPIDRDAVALSTDFKLIVPRTECSCSNCGGHLGHVFDDGPDPTGQRFCMNGIAMTFTDVTTADPNFLEEVSNRKRDNPYSLGLMQVLPSVMINGIVGGLFFSSFASKMEMTGLSSPVDILPLIPAIYFGVIAVRSCARMSPASKR